MAKSFSEADTYSPNIGGILLRPSAKVTFRTRRGWSIEFLTNDFDLQPGVGAFLFSRRWDEEKCFDTWKNDFSQSKAWGKSLTAIDSQVRLVSRFFALIPPQGSKPLQN